LISFSRYAGKTEVGLTLVEMGGSRSLREAMDTSRGLGRPFSDSERKVMNEGDCSKRLDDNSCWTIYSLLVFEYIKNRS